MLMCPSAPCRNWSIWSWRRRTASCLWLLQRRVEWSTCRTLWHRCWTIPSLSGLAALCMNRSTLMMWTSWGNSSVLQKTPWQVQDGCSATDSSLSARHASSSLGFDHYGFITLQTQLFYQGDIVSHNYVGQDNCYITVLIMIHLNH